MNNGFKGSIDCYIVFAGKVVMVSGCWINTIRWDFASLTSACCGDLVFSHLTSFLGLKYFNGMVERLCLVQTFRSSRFKGNPTSAPDWAMWDFTRRLTFPLPHHTWAQVNLLLYFRQKRPSEIHTGMFVYISKLASNAD